MTFPEQQQQEEPWDRTLPMAQDIWVGALTCTGHFHCTEQAGESRGELGLSWAGRAKSRELWCVPTLWELLRDPSTP